MSDLRKRNGGARANAGRKSKAEEMGLVALLEKCVTPKDREVCISKLAQDCKSKDFHERHESRKLLLAYIYGKPTEKHEHLGGDTPIEIIVRHVKRTKAD